MSMPLWFYNLAVYCAQLAILIATGGLLAAVTGMRGARVRLLYWQALLALGLLLPAVEPWQTAPQANQGLGPADGHLTLAGSMGMQAAATAPAHATSSFSIYELVAVVLAAGLLLRLLWLVMGIVRLRRSSRNARPLGSHAAVEDFKTELGVSPAVLVSEHISSPVTFGWRAARVLLPGKFTQMDEARQRVILCHEFLHVRRRDWLWHVAEEILRALFWFHLAVAWLIAQIRLCREQLVDREVVILAGSHRDYLGALFEIAGASHTSRHAPGLLFLSERHLKRRVSLILKEATMSRKKLVLALSASVTGLLLTGALAATLLPLRTSAAEISSPSTVDAHLVRPDTHFYGNPDARLTVVEFGDFQCPACRKAESVVEKVRKNLREQIRFAYREFPLTRFHPEAQKAAEAAECAADQGKFWQAVNYFSSQPLDFSTAGIQHFAAALGLNQARVSGCLSSGRTAARVRQDMRDAKALGVNSVPTFFVGNSKLVGTPTYSDLYRLIEQHLHGNGSAQNASPRPQPETSRLSSTTGYSANTVVADPAAPDGAVKKVRKVQGTVQKVNQAKLQRQVDKATKNALIAEQVAAKIDQAKLSRHIEEQMRQLRKLNTPKMQAQMKKQMEQLKKLNSSEMLKHMQEAMKQAEKINTPQMRKQLEKVMQQAQLDQAQAEKARSSEAQKQLRQARKELRATQEQLEQTRQELRKQRLELKRQDKQVKPPEPPPASPPPPSVPASPKKISPPSPPPASPPPPPPAQK